MFSDQELQAVLQNFEQATPSIDFNLAKSTEHVPEAEQNNCTLQEQMRTPFHSLPFQARAVIFIRYLANETAEKLNFFSPNLRHLLLLKFSPSSILTIRRIALYHSLAISRLMTSQVPRILKWHAHWIVYTYIQSVASKTAIAYTIWPQTGFLHIPVIPWHSKTYSQQEVY